MFRSASLRIVPMAMPRYWAAAATLKTLRIGHLDQGDWLAESTWRLFLHAKTLVSPLPGHVLPQIHRRRGPLLWS